MGAPRPRARVRKRGAGSAPLLPSRGASRAGCALGRCDVQGCERDGVGGESHSARILTALRAAGLGILREGAADSAEPASPGGRVAGKRRPLSFRFASPGQASSKNRTATRALAERSRPSLPAARLTRGPRNSGANTQEPARGGRRPEPQSRGPAALAQPEKLAAAARVGCASP